MRAYDHDDDLVQATRADGRARLRLRRWEDVAVVLGRGGRPERELHEERVAADGIPVYRRPGGGGTVVLDPGNLTVALTLPREGFGDVGRTFAEITDWFLAGLAGSGVPDIVPAGISDLAADGRKVSGSSLYRTRGLAYYAATLLVAPDPSLSERYLRHPPREPDYRAGRGHTAFLGSLAEQRGVRWGDGFMERLRENLTRGLSGLA